MTVGAPWRRSTYGRAVVSFTGGPAVVRWLSLDIPNDGQPAWQFITDADFRPSVEVVLGPFARAQTSTLTVLAVDSQGCQASSTIPVTVTP